MATIGNTTAASRNSIAQNRLRAWGPFSVNADIYVESVTLRLGGEVSAYQVRAVVYDEAGTLIVASAERTIAAGAADGDYTFDVTDTLVAANTAFRLGVWVGGSNGSYFIESVTGGEEFVDVTYAATAAPPSMATLTGTNNRQAYGFVTYRLANEQTASPTLGEFVWPYPYDHTESRSGNNVLGLYGPFPMKEAGRLLRAKVKCAGGTVAQDFRFGLYTNQEFNDGGGVFDRPRDFVMMSPVLNVPASGSDTTRTVELSSPYALAAGDYWLAIWFGGTGDAFIRSDQYIRSFYSSGLTFSSTGNPTAQFSFTADPGRGCPQVWFEYEVNALPAAATGTTAVSLNELPASTLVVNPHCGPYYIGGKMHLSFTTDDGSTNFSLADYDRFTAQQLENSTGTAWNFKPIRDKIALAASRGRKYGFSVRWIIRTKQGSTIYPNEGSKVPDYLTSTEYGWFHSQGTTNPSFCPDWNDEFWMSRAEALIKALGAEFDGKIAFIDMGAWGSYGEWSDSDIDTGDANYVNGGYARPTAARQTRMRQWYQQYFPKTSKVMHMAVATQLVAVLQADNTIGQRPQIVGDAKGGSATQMWGSSSYGRYGRYTLYRNWKTAPMIGEPIDASLTANLTEGKRAAGYAIKETNLFHIAWLRGENWDINDTDDAARQDWATAYRKMGYRFHLHRVDVPTSITPGTAFSLKSYWFNRNVAPAYRAWNVMWQLRAGSTVIWSQQSSLNLQTLLPTGLTPVIHSDTLTVLGVSPGDYTLTLKISDPTGEYRPLHLGTAGLTLDGAYPVSTVTVAGSSASEPLPPPLLLTPEHSQAAYKLVLRTPGGLKVAEFDDMLELDYHKEVNGPGLLRFTLGDRHRAIDLLARDAQIEVWRQHPLHDVGWYVDFYGLVETWTRASDATETVEVTAPGQLSMLGWRHVAYPAGTPDRTVFTGREAETIMRLLVEYNAGPSATTANGRTFAGAIPGLSSGTSLGQGTIVPWRCFGKNLLATLQKLAPLAGGDFDLVKTGPAAWAFGFYPGQRGTDRRTDVVFSLDRGNMAQPTLTYDYRQAKTVAIVAGQNAGSARSFVVRTSADYTAGFHRETIEDARAHDDAGLVSEGDARLGELAPVVGLDFAVLQTSATLYGKHYGLGDLVTGSYLGAKVVKKVMGVTVKLKGGKETITPTLETRSGTLVGRLIDDVATLKRRIAELETQE